MIKKKKFLLDKRNGVGASSRPIQISTRQTPSVQGRSEETIPLKHGTAKDSYSKVECDDTEDFFDVILQEMEKINKFFTGKLAELRLSLEKITTKRQNVYFNHHTSGEVDLNRLRDIYVSLAALRSYCDLNQTG